MGSASSPFVSKPWYTPCSGNRATSWLSLYILNFLIPDSISASAFQRNSIATLCKRFCTNPCGDGGAVRSVTLPVMLYSFHFAAIIESGSHDSVVKSPLNFLASYVFNDNVSPNHPVDLSIFLMAL